MCILNLSIIIFVDYYVFDGTKFLEFVKIKCETFKLFTLELFIRNCLSTNRDKTKKIYSWRKEEMIFCLWPKAKDLGITRVVGFFV